MTAGVILLEVDDVSACEVRGSRVSSVVSMNSGRMSGLIPLWNRWCCQTKKESSATPIMPAAATR